MVSVAASLPTPNQRAWIAAELARLRATCGDATFLEGPLHLPDARSFPDRWEPTVEGVRRLTDRVLRYAQLDARAEVVGYERDAAESVVLGERGDWQQTKHHGAAAWYAGTDFGAGVCKFGVDVAGLGEPISVVGTVCHEVAHAFRDAHTLTVESRDEEELLTDLTTVYLGFGVLTAGAAYVYRAQGADGLSLRGHQWSHSRRGYLSVGDLCYALALQVLARGGHEVDVVRAALEPTQRDAFDAALVSLGHVLPKRRWWFALMAPLVLGPLLFAWHQGWITRALHDAVPPSCTTAADCGGHQLDRCREGACVRLCESARDCDDGRACVHHACE